MKPAYTEKRKSKQGRVGNIEYETVFKKKVRGHCLKPSSITTSSIKHSKVRRKRKGVMNNALRKGKRGRTASRKKKLTIETSPKKTVEFADHE
jgi:hypothetical protein